MRESLLRYVTKCFFNERLVGQKSLCTHASPWLGGEKTLLDKVKDLHWPPQPHIPLTKSSNVKIKMTRQSIILKGRLEPPRMMH